MKKRMIRLIPFSAFVLFLSGIQLDASGNIVLGNTASMEVDEQSFSELVDSNKQTMYLAKDANILKDTSSVSSTIETDAKGTEVQLISVEGALGKIITPSGKVGYVKTASLTSNLSDIFNALDETKYADGDIEIKNLPQAESTTVSTSTTDDEIHIIGENNDGYYEVEVNGVVGYVSKDVLKDEKTPVVVTTTFVSNGTGLTKSAGVNYYNGRKETYYSSNVLYHYLTPTWSLDEEGFYRSNGYYVVAASDMAQGTTFECSKGTCIVLDSGCAAGTTDYYVAW